MAKQVAYQIVGFCNECIEDVIGGTIEFTKPTCLCEVSIDECDNQDVDNYDHIVQSRGEVLLDE